MAIVKCSKGHFYDNTRYSQCPHCGILADEDDAVTVSMPSQSSQSDDDKTVALRPVGPAGAGGSAIKQTAGIPAEEDDNDQGDTQHGGKGQAPAQPNCPIRVPVHFVVGQGYILDKREDETSLWRDGASSQRARRHLRAVWTLSGAGPLLYPYYGDGVAWCLMDLSKANLTQSPAHPPLAPQVSS